MNAHRFRSLVAILVLASAAIAAQEQSELVVEPEQIVADLAPLEVVVEGLPPLPQPQLVVQPYLPGDEPFLEPGSDLDPPAIVGAPLEAETLTGDTEQLFFSAGLGAASVNTVIADIGLYRVAERSRFELGYEHRSSDGFAFNDPGKGFFLQRNALGAEIELERDAGTRLGFEGSYENTSRGLQRLAPTVAVDHRSADAIVTVDHPIDERMSILVSAAVAHRSRLLTNRIDDAAFTIPEDDQPARSEQYNRFHPTAAARVEWPRFAIEFGGEFDALVNDSRGFPSVSSVEGNLILEGIPLVGLTMRADAGVGYRFDDRAYFPIEGSIEYRGSELWGADLAAGIAYSEPSPASLWDRYWALGPLDGDGTPELQEELFGEGAVELYLIPDRLTFGAALRWVRYSDLIQALPFDASSGYYPIEAGGGEQMEHTLSVTLQPQTWFTLDAAWRSRYLDRLVGETTDELTGTARAAFERFDVELSATAPLGTRAVVPRLDLSSSVSIGENLALEFFATDLLAPALEDGRSLAYVEPDEDDPFVQTGLEIGALVRISY
jgi:hypothetical protein